MSSDREQLVPKWFPLLENACYLTHGSIFNGLQEHFRPANITATTMVVVTTAPTLTIQREAAVPSPITIASYPPTVNRHIDGKKKFIYFIFLFYFLCTWVARTMTVIARVNEKQSENAFRLLLKTDHCLRPSLLATIR